MDNRIVKLAESILALQDGVSYDDVAKHLDKAFNECEVKVYREDEKLPLPTYGKNGDACCDVYAKQIEYDNKKDAWVIHTGLHFALPEGYEMQIRPRSSNTKTNLYLPNSVGTLDQGYRGELLVVFKNRTDSDIVDVLDKFGLILGTLTLDGKENLKQILDDAKNSFNKVLEKSKCPYNTGDRVAQIIIYKRPVIKWDEVKSMEELGSTERGEGGFGSTGK